MTYIPTHQTRLEMWGESARELVEDFQKYAREHEGDGSVPWRIGYLSGLKEVEDKGPDFYQAKIHQIVPHQPETCLVQIPKKSPPSDSLIRDLCWHMDQDVKRYKEAEMDIYEYPKNFPRGEILVDKILHHFLQKYQINQYNLANMICDAENFGTKSKIKLYNRKIPLLEISIKYNEITSSFNFPDLNEIVRWSNGNLTVKKKNLPETILSAARGKFLDVIFDAEMFRDKGIKIKSISQKGQDLFIVTDGNQSHQKIPI